MRKIALVTGGSSGIGYALASEFAQHDYDLILVSSNAQKLKEAGETLQKSYNVEVTCIPKDLTKEDEVKALYEEVKGKNIEVLVNDAGIGGYGKFSDVPLFEHVKTVQLNIIALMMLTHLFINDMKARGGGRILNVGSIAGFEPGPLMSVYHGTKAFVVSFTEGLVEELKDTNISVSCLCPGPVDTPFFERAHMEHVNVITKGRAVVMERREVAKKAFELFMQGKHIIIPGVLNKFMVFTRRLLPLGVQNKINKKFYEDNRFSSH